MNTDLICLCQFSFQAFCRQAASDPKQRGGTIVSTKEFMCIVSVAVIEAKLKTL